MFTLKSAVLIFTVIVSFLFPSEKTLFLALIATFASIFCDYLEFRKNAKMSTSIQRLSYTVLTAVPFFSMLLSALATGNTKLSTFKGNLVIEFIYGLESTPSSVTFDYWLFAICVFAFALENMLIVGLIRVKNRLPQKNSITKYSFQDYIDSGILY